jgi:enamine deaminase RidA (YjgF/YER057c/UK114 family)
VSKTINADGAIAKYWSFTGKNNVDEYHFTIVPMRYTDTYKQLETIDKAHKGILKSLNLTPDTIIFKRFFCSDLHNQYSEIKRFITENEESCAISLISQPSYPPAKIAMWAYHISDRKHALRKTKDNFSLQLERKTLSHFWDTNFIYPGKNSTYTQTAEILSNYKSLLKKRNMTVSENVIRTWFFIQNIDLNYKEFVEARRKFLEENGLTPQTHFIASTGVGGTGIDIRAIVSMDAYSISGLKKEQIKFLSDPEHISPTYIYGVTFERGTVVKYHERNHILISGTASINNKGEIVYPNDILKQFEHTLENIQLLLKQAGSDFDNVCVFITYVRDPSDASLIYAQMNRKFGNTPFLVVVAPVCRPGWLVEIECRAICVADNPGLPEF